MDIQYKTTTDIGQPWPDTNHIELWVATYQSKCCVGLYGLLVADQRPIDLIGHDPEELQQNLEQLQAQLYAYPIIQVDYQTAHDMAHQPIMEGSVALVDGVKQPPRRCVVYTDIRNSSCAITKDAMIDELFQQLYQLLAQGIATLKSHI